MTDLALIGACTHSQKALESTAKNRPCSAKPAAPDPFLRCHAPQSEVCCLLTMQIERHPYLTQQDLLAFHKELGVLVTAYAPLGAPGLMGDQYVAVKPLLENEAVLAVAAKHKKTPAQVLTRWSIDSGVAVIPKSVKESRIQVCAWLILSRVMA